MIFDLDDTLYDQMQPFARAVADYELTEAQLNQLYLDFRTFADEVFEAAVAGEISLEASHIYRMKSAFAKNGRAISDKTALDLQQRYVYFQGHLELPQDFVAIFETCKWYGIELGIITNGPHRHQERKIRALGLDKWIPSEYTIISGQVGVTKPSEEIFQMMEERLDLPASELVYVGDSFENDVMGSKQAGWQCLWYNHRGRSAISKKIKADAEATDARQILEWIEKNR